MTVDCFVSLLFIDGLSSYVSFPFFSFYFNTAFASILFSQTFRFILFDGIQSERERMIVFVSILFLDSVKTNCYYYLRIQSLRLFITPLTNDLTMFVQSR